MGLQLSHITNPALPQQVGWSCFRAGSATATGTIQYLKFGNEFAHVILKNDDDTYDIEFTLGIWKTWNPYNVILLKPGEQFEADLSSTVLCFKKVTNDATNPAFRFFISGPVTRKKLYPTGWDVLTAWTKVGAGTGTHSFADNTTYLRLTAEYVDGGTASNNVKAQSSNGVDITQIKTLYVDWENLGSASGGTNLARIEVTAWDGMSYTGETLATVTYNKSNAFARYTQAVDVSTRKGLCKIVFTAYGENVVGTKADVRIYNVWGEA